MKELVEGKAFVFGKNIDTDQIYPSRFVEYTEVEDIKKFAMYGADADFTKKFTAGDLIVAGTNLKGIEVGAVIAESFGRIFFRNAINLGVPVITCKNISALIHEGDQVKVDIKSGEIVNLTTGEKAEAVPMSDYIMNILQSGGIKPMLKAKMDALKNK